MSINDFVEMTIFLCLICFSIFAKMQGFVDECEFFSSCSFSCFSHSRWPMKMAGKQFLRKVASKLSRYPVGQRFHQNCSVLHRFRDKCDFAFYAEFKMTTKKCGKRFMRIVASTLSRYSASQKFHRNGFISHHIRDKCIFAFYVEIQDDCQK